MKLIDFFSPISPPVGNGPRGEVHSLLLMDSWSCLSYLHDHQKNRDEEAREISSAVVVVARDFFPLTPDLKGFLDTKKLGDPRKEAILAQLKRKSTASLTDDGTLIVDKKVKRYRNQKEKKKASDFEEEEERRNGVSTKLVLLHEPYMIKKQLKKSDLGHLSRLLIPRACVMSHVLPCTSEERARRVKSGEGADVVVWDADTRSEHRLVFVFWVSSGSYVLKGRWIKEFVLRRRLAAGDEIGMYWDPNASKFHFSLLHKDN